MNSFELFERSKKIAPGGVHSPVRAFKSVGGTPIFFKKSEGAYLESVEGKRYIDFCQSFGPMILGHRDADVSKRVHEIVDTAWCLGTCEPYSLALAEWVTSRLSFVEKIRFVSSGTEAVMSALRVARAATGRNKILKFDGCYHGHADSMLVKAGSGLAGASSADSLGISEQTSGETLVCSLNSDNDLEKIFSTRGKEIAAVIIEPLPANYGLLEQRPEFLEKICSLAKQTGALVIFDEVISGFRVGLGGVAGMLKIRPDLVTYGKIMGGGFNVGAFGGRADLMDQIAPAGRVYQAGTLSASPIGMVAGLATLEKVERINAYDVLEARGNYFAKNLASLFTKNDVPFQIDRVGSIFWIRGYSDQPIRNLTAIPAGHGEKFKKFFHACLTAGIYMAPSGYEVGFLSVAHTEQILDDALEKFERALDSYAKA